MIVVYPFITGLVVGSFVVSSFHFVFGMERFRPVARFALLTALSFIIFALTPLLLQIEYSEPAANATIPPQLSAAFGYVAALYVCILLLEIWFAFHRDVLLRAEKTVGVTGWRYRALILWDVDISEEARCFDRRWLRVLAIIGVPSAIGIHGYMCFVFGSLEPGGWWGLNLMPVIFLLSALVSGIAMLIVLYLLAARVRDEDVDHACLKGLAAAMWGFLLIGLLLETLQVVFLVYTDRQGFDLTLAYVTEPLFQPDFVYPLGLSVLSAVGLSVLMAIEPDIPKSWFSASVLAAALMMLVSVFLIWRIVIVETQEVSRTMVGSVIHDFTLWSRDGMLTVCMLSAPLVVLALLSRWLSPWERRQLSASAARRKILAAVGLDEDVPGGVSPKG